MGCFSLATLESLSHPHGHSEEKALEVKRIQKVNHSLIFVWPLLKET